MVGLLLNVGGVERSHGPRGNGLRYLKLTINEPKSGGSGLARGRSSVPNWLSSFMSTHDFAFEDGDLVMPLRLDGPCPIIPLGWEVSLR